MTLSTFDIGDLVRVTAAFTDIAGVAADPTTVTLEVKNPAGARAVYTSATSPAVVNSAVGSYYCDVPVALAGRWSYRWVGSGAVIAAAEGEFEVSLSRVL